MTNTIGTTTLTALKLARDCFSSEDDRLQEYAKALRVPVQTGEIIKGDKGDTGAQGDDGQRGAKGEKGDAGTTPTLTTTYVDLDTGISDITVGYDARHMIVNMIYGDVVNDPPSNVAIDCMRWDGAQTKIYFDVPTPDDLFKLAISYFS